MSSASLPKHRKYAQTRQGLWSFLVQSSRRVWLGAPNLSPQLRLEQRFIVLRYVGILCLALSLPFFGSSQERLVSAYVLLCFAMVYNVGVHLLLRYRPSLLQLGYITTIGDALISMMMVIAGGGFASSFYVMLFCTTIAAAMRYGYGPSLLVVIIYILFDALSGTLYHAGERATQGDFFFRSGFLAITALLAGYLQEQARAAEAALARQLDRARALNESTRALSASLRLDTVAHTVAQEIRRLIHADAVVLQLSPELDNLTTSAHTLNAAMPDQVSLLKAVVAGIQPGTPSQQHVLPNGTAYTILPLQAQSGILGYVVVTQAACTHVPADDELLTSFVERATLAVENASLYKTLGDRRRELERAYGDLAAAHQELLGVDEMKTSFIANVSHELRTPLTSIRSFSELLLSYEVDLETKQEFLTIINTESERLTRLINDVLDITKIEAGHIDWQMCVVELKDLLQTSVRTFAPLAEEKQLTLTLLPNDVALPVYVDSDRILQVLANIVGNAMKFTVCGGITLSAELVNGMVHVHVADSGIGIAPEDHERIFEKFHQVGDTLTDKPTGTGLGLCICSDIVAHHGGKIWITSALGSGSTFSFSLPLVAEP